MGEVIRAAYLGGGVVAHKVIGVAEVARRETAGTLAVVIYALRAGAITV